jgi:hypothetical protein
MKQIFLLIAVYFFSINLTAQDTKKSNFASNTFEGTRVVVGHSVEMLREGDLDFLIGHKFGRVNSGPYEFFGLDRAIIRLGFDYALKNWLNIGIGRSSLNKEVDGFLKYRMIRQKKGSFFRYFSVVGLSTMSINLLKAPDPKFPVLIQNRIAFSNQLLIARQFNERFSIQIMPTHTHFNLVENNTLRNDVFSIGFATKLQLTKAIAFKSEYYFTLPTQLLENRRNSLALGFDFDTGSHTFSTHLSNSGGLMETAFIGNTTGKWLKGDIHFGFTINRVFRLKGRRY